MDKHQIITPEYLCKRFRYEPQSGLIFWREADIDLFATEKGWKIFNKRCSGKEAFKCINSWGYKSGVVNGYAFLAHRVIYAMHTGEWPKVEIDHIDGDKLNNKIQNLRQCSGTQNRRNMPMQSNNTSGHVGVNQTNGKWVARIGGGRDIGRIHLGTFATLGEAISARQKAEVELGYSRLHGR